MSSNFIVDAFYGFHKALVIFYRTLPNYEFFTHTIAN